MSKDLLERTCKFYSLLYTVKSLYIFGIYRNGPCFKGTILQRIYRKMTFITFIIIITFIITIITFIILCLGTIGMDHVIKGQFYKGIIGK